MDDRIKAGQLLEKYRNRQCTLNEATWLMEYIQSGEDGEYLDQLLTEGLLQDVSASFENSPEVHARTETIYQAIKQKIS